MPMETGGPDSGRRPWRDRLVRRRAIAATLAGTAGLTVLGGLLVVLPGVVVDHDLAGASVAAQDRLKAVNDVRTTLLQAVGGMVVLFGAYATWRQLQVSQAGLRCASRVLMGPAGDGIDTDHAPVDPVFSVGVRQ